MTPFEYLSVLVSIIVGLALTHLLSSSARLVQQRERIRLDGTVLAWLGFLLLANIQIWWVGFDRRTQETWTFFAFLLYLLIPVTAFLLSYLVLPDFEDGGERDLRAHFAHNRRWFYPLLALLPVVSLLEETLHDGRWPTDPDGWFRMGLATAALAALPVRSARFDLLFAFSALATLCAYILLLFLRLA
jgi:hypothetical protein